MFSEVRRAGLDGLCLPVLTEQQGCQGGDHCSHAAIESPPRVLDQESHQNQDSTDRVADKHHLGYASKNPVNELEHQGFVWKRRDGKGKDMARQMVPIPKFRVSLRKIIKIPSDEAETYFLCFLKLFLSKPFFLLVAPRSLKASSFFMLKPRCPC